MSQAQKNCEYLENAYKAMFSGDLDGFLNHFHEEAEMIEAESLPYGGTFRGIDAIRGAIMEVAQLWEGFNFAVDEMVANDTTVIAYGTFSATARATGKHVSFPITEVTRFRDGQISLIHPIYSDTHLALKALSAD